MPTKPPPGIMDDLAHPLSKGCVGHWLFNEGTGSLAYDISGHGNHGALKNMSPNAQDSGWGGSKFGGGLNFDGTNDYIDCGNHPSLQSGTFGSVEFSMFFPEVVAQEEAIVVKATSWAFNNQAWRFALYDEAQGPILRFNLGDGTTHSGWVSTLLNINTWYHIVATWNDGITKLYKNGVEVDDGAYPFSITPDYNVYLGDWGTGAGAAFSGKIDNLRIYNRVSSAEEIKQLYHDPFCNLMRVPAWQLYTPAGAGYDVSMQLTQALQIAQLGAASANSVLNLSEVLSVVIAGQMTSNASITLNTGYTIELNASAVANSTLALAIYLTLVQATGTEVDVAITLSHALAFTDIAQVSASASFTLNNIASLSQTGLATAEAALSLGYNNAITNTSTSAISAQLALAISAGINTAATIAISEDISLSQNLTIQSLALTEAEGELSLDQILALTIVGEAIATANLPLSEIYSITITATTVDILLGDISDPTILSITVDRAFKSQTKKRSFQHTM